MVVALSLFQKQQDDLATLSLQPCLGVSPVLECPHSHSDRLCCESVFFFSPSNCLEFWTLWWQEATVFPKRLQSNGPLKSPRAAYLKVVIKTQLHLKLLPVSIWYDICGSVDHCEESRSHSWPERLDVLHLWLHPPVGEPLAEASPQPLLSSFLDNSLPLGSACWLSVNYAFKGMETNWFLCQSLLLPLQSYFKRP